MAILKDEKWIFACFRTFPADFEGPASPTGLCHLGALLPVLIKGSLCTPDRRPTMPLPTDPFDRFQKAAASIAGLITAVTGAALAGHTIGWW